MVTKLNTRRSILLEIESLFLYVQQLHCLIVQSNRPNQMKKLVRNVATDGETTRKSKRFQVIELSLSYRFDLNQSVGESIDTLE